MAARGRRSLPLHRLADAHPYVPARRDWHAHRHTTGNGHLYQGRFKSFPVQTDEHFLILCRYVERNPLRAGLVERAEQWPWSSLATLHSGNADQERPPLADWPVQRPSDWLRLVNHPQTPQEEDAIRASIVRGRPLGDPAWQKRTAIELGLELTLRPRGRPRQERQKSLEIGS